MMLSLLLLLLVLLMLLLLLLLSLTLEPGGGHLRSPSTYTLVRRGSSGVPGGNGRASDHRRGGCGGIDRRGGDKASITTCSVGSHRGGP